jgi:hypothetical protein
MSHATDRARRDGFPAFDPPPRRWGDPRRIVDALDSHAARRIWGRWPVVRVVLAYGIWLARYRMRRGH